MQIDFKKNNGLVPAIIQDASSGAVLMLGYMNEEALNITRKSGRVTFFSRSKQRLWTKGEESGNFLTVVKVFCDCDEDTILITAQPTGPTCHTGSQSCFGEQSLPLWQVLSNLEKTIVSRRDNPKEGSYTAQLFLEGTPHIAQKVGEEAVECTIAALCENNARVTEEAADLFYHLLTLLAARDVSMAQVVETLKRRQTPT